MNIKDIISRLEYAANHPKEMMKEHLDAGQKVIGCFPVFCPEELVHAAGMVPMGIWGGNIEIVKAKEYFPAFACSMVMAQLEYGIKGSYKGLSAVIIPAMSDTLITLTQNWKSAIKDIPMIGFVHPQNRKIEAAVDYLITEYELVKSSLEKISGVEVTEEALKNSIDVFNEHRKVMMEFVEMVPDYLNTFTPTLRSAIIKSGHFMRKEEHTQLVRELVAHYKAQPKENFTGKKVLVTGIILDDKNILQILEENDLAIAYDNVAHETVQFATPIPDQGKTQIERLARQWSNIEGCSLAYDPEKKRGKLIEADVKRLGLDAVLYAMLAFSDYEEYDYPIFKKDMEKAGIPHLLFEVEQGSPSIEQLRTRVQTFAEIL
ncbi:MAG: 2-hydroxyacyl-CoA dehydratase family protein [Bacillota bacterium]|nr:2-hydroxyacyl-CoA dehydratase family protein [Bacillota bacterium]